jgi:integral membrane protein
MTAAETRATDARKPDPGGKIRSALTRYRVLAWITGVWLLVLTVEMVYKYLILESSSDAPEWFTYIGQAHGVFYIIYLFMTLDLAIKARWQASRTLLTALAGTIPFLSFLFEHMRTRDVRAEYAV